MLRRSRTFLLLPLMYCLAVVPVSAGWFSNDDYQVGELTFSMTLPDDVTFVAARSVQTVRYADSTWLWDIIPQETVKVKDVKTVVRTAATKLDGRRLTMTFGAGALSLAEQNPDQTKGGTLRDVAHDIEITVKSSDGRYVTAELSYFRNLSRKRAIEAAHEKRLHKKMAKRYDGLAPSFRGYMEETAQNGAGEPVTIGLSNSDTFDGGDAVRGPGRSQRFESLYGK